MAAAADSAVFKKLDADGDGAISKSEFESAVSGHEAAATTGTCHLRHRPTRARRRTPARAAASTDPLDVNGDGVVSASELAAGQFKELITKA